MITAIIHRTTLFRPDLREKQDIVLTISLIQNHSIFELRHSFLQVTMIKFCNEENTLVIQGKPARKRQRTVTAKSTTRTKRPRDQSCYAVNIQELLKRALEVMAKNEMMIEMFGDTVHRLSQFSLGSFSDLTFLNEVFEKTVEMKTFSIERMWTNSNTVWVNEDITSRLIGCLDVPQEFSSWLLLYCQEEIAKDHCQTSVAEVKNVKIELSEHDKETVTYICGAVISKLIRKAHDNLRKPGIKAAAKVVLENRINALNCCKSSQSARTYTGQLIETLDRGGLTYPKATFAELFHRTEKVFRVSVSGSVTKINVASIVSKVFIQEASMMERSKSMFDSALLDNIKDIVLKDIIKICVKLSTHAHAKHLIENHKSATRKQKKEKALRKKLKFSSNDKQ